MWPSNDYLVSRTGLSERAIRAAFRILIDQQLIVPKDSPNGKRYAVKDLAGELVDAFGFDLTPVYARRGEWADVLIEMKQAQEARKRAFDEITIAGGRLKRPLVLWPSIIPISIAPTSRTRSKALKPARLCAARRPCRTRSWMSGQP